MSKPPGGYYDYIPGNRNGTVQELWSDKFCQAFCAHTVFEDIMMTDERKPLAPDRPGRYLLRDGKTSVTVLVVFGKFATDTIPTGNLWINGAVPSNRWWDIIARAPDDAAWCLAQTRLLCPEGYVVIKLRKLEKLEAQISGGLCYFAADAKHAQLKDAMETVKALIASATEGK